MAEQPERPAEEAKRLHGEEDQEKQIAESLPEGSEKDEHRMRGERLSDKAWEIEEANDIQVKPSGLWPDRGFNS